MKHRLSKATLILIGAVALFIVGTAQADATTGVTVTVYNNGTWNNQYNNAPPLPPTTPVAGTMHDTDIEHNFDADPLFGLTEDFVVRYEGYLAAPTDTVYFLGDADDGVRMYVDGQLVINDWYDKGGGGSVSNPVTFTPGQTRHIVVWFYENGGGAYINLMWMADNGWETIPASAYSSVDVWHTTTTSSVPPTTEPSTTSSSTSSSTSTTQPDPPTTTLTTNPPTMTVPSSTATENTSPPSVTSTTSSLPLSTSSPTTTVLKMSPTTSTSSKSILQTTTSLSSTTTQTTLNPEASSTTDPSSSISSESPNPSNPTYTKQVRLGPISFKVQVTKAQRTTVVAAAIVQITAVASISTVTTGGSTSTDTRRRRR